MGTVILSPLQMKGQNIVISFMVITLVLSEVSGHFNDMLQDLNATWSRSWFPLKIPSAIKEHVTKSLDMTKIDTNYSNVFKRSTRKRRQISPGVYSCGHQGNEMFINFINPQYPGPDTAAGTCRFRLMRNSPDVCQVRVDFVDTEFLTPKDGNCNEQYFMVSGTIWPIGVNQICGINPDQHFYVHFNDGFSQNEEHIDFTITTSHAAKPYKFGIWITQINCR